jgi:hypothetical protein
MGACEIRGRLTRFPGLRHRATLRATRWLYPGYNAGCRVTIEFWAYAGPLGMSENRVSHATGPMLAATISSAASAPSSKLPRLANW